MRQACYRSRNNNYMVCQLDRERELQGCSLSLPIEGGDVNDNNKNTI